jgi:hypothetical protein
VRNNTRLNIARWMDLFNFDTGCRECLEMLFDITVILMNAV